MLLNVPVSWLHQINIIMHIHHYCTLNNLFRIEFLDSQTVKLLFSHPPRLLAPCCLILFFSRSFFRMCCGLIWLFLKTACFVYCLSYVSTVVWYFYSLWIYTKPSTTVCQNMQNAAQLNYILLFCSATVSWVWRRNHNESKLFCKNVSISLLIFYGFHFK